MARMGQTTSVPTVTAADGAEMRKVEAWQAAQQVRRTG